MPSDCHVGIDVKEYRNYHAYVGAMLFCRPPSTVTLPAVDGWSYPSCLSIGWSCRAVTFLVFVKRAVSTDRALPASRVRSITEYITQCLLRVHDSAVYAGGAQY